MNAARSRKGIPAAAVVLAVAVLAACGGGGGSSSGSGGPVAAPSFTSVDVPDPLGTTTWVTAATSVTPPPAVLPTRGRGVRLNFTAPAGASFNVSLKDLPGTTTATLNQNPSGSNPGPTAGYFEIIAENANVSPATYKMYVRTPSSWAAPNNYDIAVVHASLRTDMTDSSPMIVPLRQRPFMLTVTANGSGHITSAPPGIQCGTSSSGASLTPCAFDFAPSSVPINVVLEPQGNTSAGTVFKSWSGSCAPGVQICTVTLDGTSAKAATATFGASGTGGGGSSACSTPPAIQGKTWIDTPDCASNDIAGHPGATHPALCDAQGYYCCEPSTGATSQRCGGAGKHEFPPDCMRDGPRAQLIQPGGCYTTP